MERLPESGRPGQAEVRTVSRLRRAADSPDAVGRNLALAGIPNERNSMTREDMLNRAKGILADLDTRFNANNLDQKDWNGRILKRVYDALQATKLAAESDRDSAKSVLGIDRRTKNVYIKRPMLDTLASELNKVTGVGLPGPMGQKMSEMVTNGKQILLELAALNFNEEQNFGNSILYQDPEAARKFAKKFCRDPDNIKGASKMVLVLGLGAILLLNGIRDLTAGKLSWVTAVLLGIMFFLVKKDKKYAFLNERNFNDALGERNFQTGGEARSFAEEVMNLPTAQKSFLAAKMKERYHTGRLQPQQKQVELTDLTDPQRSNNRGPDARKAIPRPIAERFMAMSPEDAHILAQSLTSVSRTDSQLLLTYIEGSKRADVPKDLRNLARSPEARAQAEAAVPEGVVPRIPREGEAEPPSP